MTRYLPRVIGSQATQRLIHQRADGRWCGQVLVGYNELGKPVRKTFYGATREEVAKKVSEGTHQVFNGKMPTVRKEKMTVKKLVLDFLWTFKKPSVADVTFEWYLNAANTHIIPALGETIAAELTPFAIQSMLNDMHIQQNLSNRTLKVVRDVLNQAYTHAIGLKLMEDNPVSGTKLPKQSRVKAEQKENTKVIPVADRAKILAAAENDLRMKTALTVLMFTGARIGEFLALPWGNVDFKSGTITIDRALTHTCEYNEDGSIRNRSKVVGATKTQCSVRKIKAPPVVMDVLNEWRAALPDHVRIKGKQGLLDADAPVFPNDLGVMRSYDGFRTTYRRFMSENGLGDYPLHSYRHVFATMLLEAEVNPKVVQKLLGHRDIETTLGIYSHVLPEVFDSTAETIGAIHAGMMIDKQTQPIEP